MLQRYGITRNHIRDSMRYSILTILAGICVITAVGLLVGFRGMSMDLRWLVFYVIISVPAQELVFRGVIQTHLYKVGAAKAIIITSVLFSAIHFANPLLVALTLAAGLVWGYSFFRKPNLAGPVVSHAVLGTYLFLLVL